MSDELQPGQLKNLDKGNYAAQNLVITNGVIMPQTHGELVEYAQMMCKGGLALPVHFRNNPGMCVAVIKKAMRWEMDEWEVANKTYAVNDRLAYEGQLISAVVKKWAPVKEKVWNPIYEGNGAERTCSFLLHHAETGEEITYKSPKIGKTFDESVKKPSADYDGIWPKNSPLWRTEPDQQLFYYSIRALARRHLPDILMGVYDRDEVMAMKDITPKQTVQNFLEDESEGELKEVVVIQSAQSNTGHTVSRSVGTAINIPLDQTKVKPGDEVLFDGVTGEIYASPKAGSVEIYAVKPEQDPPLVIPPEVIARNLISSLRGETDTVRLETWQNDNQGAINALPPALLKDVRKALADKFLDLAEL